MSGGGGAADGSVTNGPAMDGRAGGEGRVYQAAGDQQIVEHHHHGDFAPGDTRGIESVRRPTGGRAPVVFRDRTELMERLHAAVDGASGGRIYVLHGMGGCGKTAVAHAVFRYATDVADRVGLWVNASDRASLRGGMLAVAADRGAGEGELLAARNGLRAAADLVWDRLDSSRQPWLLVLDNADDPAVLQDGWLRSSPRGTVLVTTRQAAAHWWTDAELHHVGVLPSEAAAQVLCDLAPGSGSVEEAREVADRLGRLPLALTLAGGFLAHQLIEPWTMSKYGSQLTEDPEQGGFVELIDQGAESLPGREPRGLVGKTWQLSLDALAAQGVPESATLLRLLASYGPDPLPLSLLGGLDVDGLLPRSRVEAALRGLVDQSLVTMVDAGVHCVQVHGVLLASVAAGTPDAEARRFAATACRLLDAVVPEVPERGPQDLRLRLLAPHALAVLRKSVEPGVAADVLDVAIRLAIALHRTGDYLSAYELASESAAVAERVLGAEHRLVLRARGREGRALFRLGRFEEAEALFAELLEVRKGLFGPDDPDTLDSYYSLGLPLWEMNRGTESIALLRRALAGRERVFGPVHPLTLRTRSALLTYLPLSELAAELDTARMRLPRLCALELGAHHGVTIEARHNLAYALYVLGRLDEAGREAESVVELYKHRLGPDYPVTFAAQSLHARIRSARGHWESAIEIMTHVVVGRRRILGAEHPYTSQASEYLRGFKARAAEGSGPVSG